MTNLFVFGIYNICEIRLSSTNTLWSTEIVTSLRKPFDLSYCFLTDFNNCPEAFKFEGNSNKLVSVKFLHEVLNFCTQKYVISSALRKTYNIIQLFVDITVVNIEAYIAL